VERRGLICSTSITGRSRTGDECGDDNRRVSSSDLASTIADPEKADELKDHGRTTPTAGRAVNRIIM